MSLWTFTIRKSHAKWLTPSAIQAWTSQKTSYLQEFGCTPCLCIPNLSKLSTKFSSKPLWGKPPSLVAKRTTALSSSFTCPKPQWKHRGQTVTEGSPSWILFHLVFLLQLVWIGTWCLSSATGVGFSTVLFFRHMMLNWPLTIWKPFGQENPMLLGLVFQIRTKAPVFLSSLSYFSVFPRKSLKVCYLILQI